MERKEINDFDKTYILMSAAYNEEAYIQRTIQSVIDQTILPLKWIIVSDGSTDRTDEILLKFSENFDFIEFLRREKMDTQNFCSKVSALNLGYNFINSLKSDFIGNLDADIVLPNDYYEGLIGKFENNPQLGIISGQYVELNDGKIKRFKIPNYHTPGSIQLFKRGCFEKIGGYPKLNGGEDVAAGVLARMNGWETRSFTGYEALHLKPLHTGDMKNVLRGRYRLGKSDYNLGMHPIFAVLKMFRQMLISPYFIGGIVLFNGYFFSWLQKVERGVSQEFIVFFQKEQFERILSKKLIFFKK